MEDNTPYPTRRQSGNVTAVLVCVRGRLGVDGPYFFVPD